MDFEVSLAFENINADARGRRGAVAMASTTSRSRRAWVARRSVSRAQTSSRTLSPALTTLMEEYQVPVVLEFILERVTNISMGTEINGVNEFEEILCLDPKLSIK